MKGREMRLREELQKFKWPGHSKLYRLGLTRSKKTERVWDFFTPQALSQDAVFDLIRRELQVRGSRRR